MDSMDFHSLSRRELQSLCKKNKIPANMTNIAMADALTALTNVIGIDEIGQSESTMPETPLTSRRTTVRKTATKPQAVESVSTLTRPRRATAKKIIKEEDPMDLSEITSVNDTPAPRTGRRGVAGTSVCRKLDAQTQEVKEESKEERPVVHGYSTRRSSRLQSGQKISESVQKRGGRKTEAVMIGVLSEEEADDVQMKPNSDAVAEVQENQGDNVMVLSAVPDASPQEDLISEDGSSSTLVSADVSSCIEEVSSANQGLISESKDDFSVEQLSEQQDMSNEVSSCINDAHVSEISVSERKAEITVEDVNKESDDLQYMEVKEESAVDVISPNVSSQKTAQMPVASPVQVEGKTNDPMKTDLDCLMSSLSSDQVDAMTNEDIMVESNEVNNADDSILKFSFEDELCDMDSEVFDFENMNETMEVISNLGQSNQVAAPLECEKVDGVEKLDAMTAYLPVVNLTDANVSSPTEVASKDNQVKSDVSVSVEQLEIQKVDSVKCDSIASVEGVKVDSLLDDASTDEEDSNNESGDNDESDDNDESVDNDESDDDDESDNNVDEIHESPIAGMVKSQNPVTPIKSPSAKKTTTPNSKMVIKVLEDTEENNKSGKVSLKSNSKLLTSGVAEEKENSDNNKGESTAQKSLRNKSIRKLKKMLSELTINSTTGGHNKKTLGKEDLQVVKRSALQMLNDNSLVGEEEKRC